ncbi:MAG: 2-oxoglutarate and iron-dependent oxygenase domain-containing protein, partial [Candidatus Binataceae bacterium]
MASSTIPIIEIAPFQSGDADSKRRVAAAVNRACGDNGFFVITGHGVDPAFCEQVFRAAAEFFALPLEEKLKWKRWAEDVGRGYAPLTRESSA